MPSRTQLKFEYVDALSKSYAENLGNIDRNKFIENFYTSDTTVKRAFLQEIDSGCRAIAALTTNTYNGATITSEIDINEELIPEGGE